MCDWLWTIEIEMWWHDIPYHRMPDTATEHWLGIERRTFYTWDTKRWDMYEETGGYANERAIQGMPKQLTVREQIQMRVKSLEQELERQNKMLKLLDENPVIEEWMNLTR